MDRLKQFFQSMAGKGWDKWLPKNEAELRGTTFSAQPEKDRHPLIGLEGRAVTSLHPTGEILVEGRRYDAVADGCFIEPEQVVRVTELRDFRLVVRPAS